jgi:putative membrane protein
MPAFKTTLSTTCAALLFLAAAGTSAQPATSASAAAGTTASGNASSRSSAVPAADRAFMQKAAMGGLAEVALGNMAQQKASSDQVKQYGARMVQDHTAANNELMQIASAKGVQLPTAPDKKHQQDMDRMEKLSGAQFDKAYMSHMVADHKKDVSDYKKEASSGKDPDVKAFAAKTLPTLQEHLQLAQTTHRAVQKGGK